ncbi:UTRA domain-containing protein [Dongia soli]|uniref:UTRA domain-containing protein n=1 Tax=Dongia soli TaxID=600628 RepID=A0ABU5E5M1_9PROT|nr:UTRA domain-containing protein [Dongia soli]MDY0881471.1 UTRA domain-containing protein [Dongia soli]
MQKPPKFVLDGQGPLFKQIGRAVTEQILKGRYKQGERLPSEAELTDIFSTSRQTVNKAITELAKHGLVERNRRAGTVVSWQFQERFVLPLRDVADDLEQSSQVYEYRILERKIVRNGKNGIRWSALPSGSKLLYLQTLHLADGLPVQLETRYINYDTFPDIEQETFADIPPSKWLLLNIPWSEVDHAIRATNATEELAQKLGVRLGTSCLVVDRQTFHRGKPITFVHMVYPGDRFSIKGRFNLETGQDWPQS